MSENLQFLLPLVLESVINTNDKESSLPEIIEYIEQKMKPGDGREISDDIKNAIHKAINLNLLTNQNDANKYRLNINLDLLKKVKTISSERRRYQNNNKDFDESENFSNNYNLNKIILQILGNIVRDSGLPAPAVKPGRKRKTSRRQTRSKSRPRQKKRNASQPTRTTRSRSRKRRRLSPEGAQDEQFVQSEIDDD